MKYYISMELGCVFKRNRDDTVKELEYAPIINNNTFNTEEFASVEPDLVGEEEVTFMGENMNLYKVWKIVNEQLEIS